MRLDQFAMQIHAVLNRLFQQSNATVKAVCPVYCVIPKEPKGGFIEFIEGAQVMTKAIVLQHWNSSATMPPMLGFMLCGHITAVVNRLHDNVLFKKGTLINIDFTSHLGILGPRK